MIDLDKKILAFILSSKSNAMTASSLGAEYFDIKLQWLYCAIMSYFNNPKYKELPTENIIKEYLVKNYSQQSFIDEGIQIFREICALEVDQPEFNWYLGKLKNRYNDQIQKKSASDIVKLMKDHNISGEERVDKVNSIYRQTVMNIDSIHKKESYEEGSLDQSAKARALKYKAVKENPDLARGQLTGFSELDRITNGFHPGELIIIAGSTGSGKSILMQNMAVNAYLGGLNPMIDPPDDSDVGANVLYFSLEMPKDVQEMRIDACMAEIPTNSIRDGALTAEEEERYGKALKFQTKHKKKFHIVDIARGVTPRDIELKYLEACDEHGIDFDLVVIDYLALMRASYTKAGSSDWLDLGTISEELHEFGREYKIPVLTASQLNRPKDPSKQLHSTDRLARSNMIPDNANIILQIDWRGEDEHTRIDMPVFIIKMRQGEKGSFTLVKNFGCMKVVDLIDEEIFNNDDDDI